MTHRPIPVPHEVKKAHTENVTAVLTFLLWAWRHDPKMMFGSRSAAEAYAAFCNMIGVDPQEVEKKL